MSLWRWVNSSFWLAITIWIKSRTLGNFLLKNSFKINRKSYSNQSRKEVCVSSSSILIYIRWWALPFSLSFCSVSFVTNHNKKSKFCETSNLQRIKVEVTFLTFSVTWAYASFMFVLFINNKASDKLKNYHHHSFVYLSSWLFVNQDKRRRSWRLFHFNQLVKRISITTLFLGKKTQTSISH